jgi:nucleotide-binding universal stress UspA family protein
MMFERVLAAADFRRRPDPAVVSGARLARLTGAELHVLHCASGDVESPAVAGADAEALPSGTRLWVHHGEPHQAIVERANAVPADVIVLGPRNERSAASGLLGTTADRVIRASRRPCLLANGHLQARPARLLLALDRSAPARQAFRVGMGLARDLAVQADGHFGVHILTISAFAEPGTRVASLVDVKRYAERMQAAVGAAAVSHGIYSAALPADGILAYLRSESADLLIMGTHGSGVLGLMLLGSVAREVARAASIPLLLVPPERRRAIHIRHDPDPA